MYMQQMLRAILIMQARIAPGCDPTTMSCPQQGGGTCTGWCTGGGTGDTNGSTSSIGGGGSTGSISGNGTSMGFGCTGPHRGVVFTPGTPGRGGK